MKLTLDTRKNHRQYGLTDRTEGIGPDWSTSETIERITMNTFTIHDVTSTTISQGVHDAFTCQTLTIETADGQTIALKLFRSEPQADGVKDVLQDAQDTQDLMESLRDDEEAREAQEAQEAQEAAEDLAKGILLSTIRDTLEDWGYNDYPHYNALVHELFLEAQRPGNDVNLNAPSLISCLTWGTSSAGSSFYSKAYTWLQNNY